MSKKKILFISHDATRTGAPMVLLYFLRWLKNNTDIPFEIILRKGGKLKPEFKKLARVTVFNPECFIPFFNKNRYHNKLKNRLLKENIGLIYSNTITNGFVQKFLSFLNCPMICHVHELEHSIKHIVDKINLLNVKKYTTHYIAGSKAVKECLIDHNNIPNNVIDLVYEYIPIKYYKYSKDRIIKMKHRLNIPKNAFVVGGAGTMGWRKGSDLFVQLAKSLTIKKKMKMPAHFLWLGSDPSIFKDEYDRLMYDIEKSGLKKAVHLIGTKKNYMDYFALFDVFTMISREDSFPLVNLEAAILSKPVICFDASGSSKDFVEDDCGFVIPYLNIDKMAEKIIKMMRAPALVKRLGKAAREKVIKEHDVNNASEKLLNIINRFMLK
ncbi:glycosyltransferase family 4 protein [Candidatus Margulisiibacteriota bacterium]